MSERPFASKSLCERPIGTIRCRAAIPRQVAPITVTFPVRSI